MTPEQRADPSTPPAPTSSVWRNWLTLSGLMIAIGSLFAFILLFAIDLMAHQGNPYMGILAYVVAPAFLILGLSIMGCGMFLQLRYRRKNGHQPKSHVLVMDFSRPREKRILTAFLTFSVVFLMLTALGSYQTYHMSESNTFCGLACHQPMKPEFTAFQDSPHARIGCVDCHVGPGAGHFLRAKINGVSQLYHAVRDSYERPIKTPLEHMRFAEETCGQCHWPDRYIGQVDRTYNHFLADEANTPFTVRIMLNVGGGNSALGPAEGIHWHMSVENKVEYIATDERREEIPWVRVTGQDGKQTVYKWEEFTDDPADHEIRTMDCMDCHNRPAHRFQSPNDAVDLALSTGRIDASLAWVKSNVVATLTAPYKTEDEALVEIANRIRASYANYSGLDRLITETQRIFKRNFFPEMGADWRAYPDHSGHKDSAGCFRCHDGYHEAENSDIILGASDCNSCHVILAQGSGESLKNMDPDGHTFFHVDSEYEDFDCANCHNGQIQTDE